MDTRSSAARKSIKKRNSLIKTALSSAHGQRVNDVAPAEFTYTEQGEDLSTSLNGRLKSALRPSTEQMNNNNYAWID